MNVSKTTVASLDKESGEELVEELGEPDLLMVYFTIEHELEENIESFSESIRSSAPEDTVIGGVSVSAFITDEEKKIDTTGALAIGLKGVDVSADSLNGDPWTAETEKAYEVLDGVAVDEGINFAIKTGARQAESSSTTWDLIQKLIVRFKKHTYLRETMIDRINNIAKKNHIGYPTPTNTAIKKLNFSDTDLFVAASMDGGSYEKGYEFTGEKLTESEGLISISVDSENIEMHHPFDDGDRIEKLDIVRRYEDIETYKNTMYSFDGKSFSEVKDELPIASKRLEHGGFSYYCYLKGVKSGKAAPIPATEVLIDSHNLIEEPENLLIVRSPSFSKFTDTMAENLPETGENTLTQISLHSSLMDFYGNKIGELADMIDKKEDRWFAVIGDVWKEGRYENFMHPTTITYTERGD